MKPVYLRSHLAIHKGGYLCVARVPECQLQYCKDSPYRISTTLNKSDGAKVYLTKMGGNSYQCLLVHGANVFVFRKGDRSYVHKVKSPVCNDILENGMIRLVSDQSSYVRVQLDDDTKWLSSSSSPPINSGWVGWHTESQYDLERTKWTVEGL